MESDMFLDALLRLPMPVLLALAVLLPLLAVVARVLFALRRPVVVRPAEPAPIDAVQA
jgi:hypothetical protein